MTRSLYSIHKMFVCFSGVLYIISIIGQLIPNQTYVITNNNINRQGAIESTYTLGWAKHIQNFTQNCKKLLKITTTKNTSNYTKLCKYQCFFLKFSEYFFKSILCEYDFRLPYPTPSYINYIRHSAKYH